MIEVPMESCGLRPNDYLDPAVLAAEHECIFFREWHIVGLTRDLPRFDDWFLTKIAGTEVIVQNFGDHEIRAFTNTCPHRFNAIRQSPTGNGALRCSYHLWSFDHEGALIAAPMRGNLSLETCRLHARLEQWSTQRCGDWIFVSRNPQKTLKESLGSYFEEQATLSVGLGREIASYEQEIGANWKLLLENTMEFEHIYSIHPDTFAPLWPKPISSVQMKVQSPHMSYLARFKPPDIEKSTTRKIEKIFDRAVLAPTPGLVYLLISPSATIGRTYRQIALITYQPIAPDRTLVKVRLFIPRINNLSMPDNAILDKILPEEVAFTRKLLDEDIQICVSVQRGLTNAPEDMKGSLMPGDQFIQQWHQYWLQAMGRT